MEGKIETFRDLEVWQEAMNLVIQIYKITKIFPKEEMFCLTNQMRRAAISIPSNIAEGNSRKHTKEYLNFLSIAEGSLAELRTQIEIAYRLEYLNEAALNQIYENLNKIGRMMTRLIQALERKL